jgi:hypothetical protein
MADVFHGNLAAPTPALPLGLNILQSVSQIIRAVWHQNPEQSLERPEEPRHQARTNCD